MIQPSILGYSRIDSWLRYLPKTEGEITGIYQNSFDVRVMDFLLNFNVKEEAIHPLGIHMVVSLQKNVVEKQKVQVAFPSFTVGGITFLTEARSFASGEKHPEGSFLRENTTRILQVLKNFGRCSEAGEAYINHKETKFAKPLLYLCLALKKTRLVTLDEYMANFGGGAGLTPAWDDFCMGLLLTDRIFRGNAILLGKNFFKDFRPKTTIQSFWNLKFAEVGKSSLLFERFIQKLSTVKISSTEVVRCLNYGHSSGTDILCGIHAYISNFLLV